MAYLGNTPTQQGFIPAIDFFSGNGSTTAFTLSRPVASVAQVQATIENVPQNPGTAFTVSGNTITFDGAPASGTNNIYVYYTSPITQVIQPGQGTVAATQIEGNYALWNKSGSDINYTAGNVLVNTAAASNITGGSSSGGGFNSSGQLITSRATTSSSVHHTFYNSNGAVGTIQTSGSATNYYTTSSDTTGAVLINSGVQFPATQVASANANTLDDYEEGNWTPVLGGFSSVTYTSRVGSYIKIGRMVYVFWDFEISSRTGSWNEQINSLPFTVSGNMAGYSVVLHRSSNLFNTGVSGGQLKGFVNQNTTDIVFQVDFSGTSGFGLGGAAGANASGRSTGCVMYTTSN